MNETAMTTRADQPVARPLKVLVPLIKQDLEKAHDAAEAAGMPYYRAAGEKLLEAKGGRELSHGEFVPWVERHFKISIRQAQRYMSLVDTEKRQARRFSSINDHLRELGDSGYVPNKPRPQPWHKPVSQTLGRVNVEALNREAMKRAEERELQRKLALQLIDIGFKALATKLHPDRGGSHEAMVRLKTVRDRLKQSA